MPFWLHEYPALVFVKSVLPRRKLALIIAFLGCASGAWLLVVYSPLQHDLRQKTKELKIATEQEALFMQTAARYDALLADYTSLVTHYYVPDFGTQSLQQILSFFLATMHTCNVACRSLIPCGTTTTQTHDEHMLSLVAHGDFHNMLSFFQKLQVASKALVFTSFVLRTEEDNSVCLEAGMVVKQLKSEYLNHA